MYLVKIKAMRAVGMHHWGRTTLDVGCPYTLKWEPLCEYDPGNAVAIYDSYDIKRAYITREDAKVLSKIFSKNIAIHDMMALKPVTYAHCVCQELGPQHECTVIFHTNLSKRTMSAYLEANNCTFRLQ